MVKQLGKVHELVNCLFFPLLLLDTKTQSGHGLCMTRIFRKT